MINIERLKSVFLDLVNINSPSKSERGVADYVKAKLTDLGFEVTEDDTGEKIGGNAGNVIAFLAGNGGTSIFLGSHMDTVEPTPLINLIIDGDLIRTDGSSILGADDKAGIAAILEAVTSTLEDKSPHGDIQIVFNVSEETGLNGSRHMDKSAFRAKMGYVFDTSQTAGGMTISAPSHETMTIEIHGKAAHAGMAPEDGISAIIAASNAISKMKLGRIDEETTANVGRIEGGKTRNIVPDFVTIKAEARSRNEAKLQEQLRHMTETFEREAKAIGATADVKSEHEYTTYRWTQDDEVVKLAIKASNKLGIEPSFEEGGGGSDANIFNAAGIPTLLIGLGYRAVHTPAESIRMTVLANAAKFAEALIAVAAEAE